MTTICGIDEAGRGPVIGPMVMCGVVVGESEEHLFKGIGVADSKLLTPAQREELFGKIINIADAKKIIIIPPEDIDKALNSKKSNLNWLEADKTAEIINELKPDKAFIDCPSNNEKAYWKYILKKLDNKKTKLIVEHGADINYPVASAASILAKVTRDREIENLKKEFNVHFGSGYPSDPVTARFLEENYNKYPFFRRTWESWKTIAEKRKQRRLEEF